MAIGSEKSVDPHEADPAPAVGVGPRVSFDCPECAHTAQVDWKNLHRPMRCPKCDCRFLIDRDGKLRSFAKLVQVHFTCPRCGQHDSFPSTLIDQGIHCPACRLPLVRGSDERLHGVKELAEQTQRQRQSKTRPTEVSRRVDRTARPNRNPLVLISGSLLGLALLFCAFLMLSGGSPGAGDADNLVRECLAGNWEGAASYVGDDPVQRTEFERWSIRYFASIQDRFRAPGDSVRVESSVMQADDNQRLLRVAITSPVIGARTHLQIWRNQDGQWLFDPHATLAKQDGRPQ